MESTKVRLRLSGRRIHEQPIPIAVGHHPPKIGDLIEVPHDGHSVRARVTSTSSPICRDGDLVTYLVYAHELDGQEIQEGNGQNSAR